LPIDYCEASGADRYFISGFSRKEIRVIGTNDEMNLSRGQQRVVFLQRSFPFPHHHSDIGYWYPCGRLLSRASRACGHES